MRRDRLLLISAFATALLTLLGAVSESLGMDRLLKSNTSKTRYIMQDYRTHEVRWLANRIARKRSGRPPGDRIGVHLVEWLSSQVLDGRPRRAT